MSQYILLSLGLILVALVVAILGSLLVAQLRALKAQKQAQAISLQKLYTELLIAQKALKTAESGGSVWSGIRKFSVIKKVPETSDATSFYLAPHDKKPVLHGMLWVGAEGK